MKKTLPQRTQDYLLYGAREGERNDALLHAACQYRDADYLQSEAEAVLIARATLDGLSESEALRTIESAYARPAREPIGLGHTSAVIPFPVITKPNGNGSGAPGPLPAPIMPGFIPYMEAVFRPNEYVAIADSHVGDDNHVIIDAGTTLLRDEWIERVTARGGLEKQYTGKSGVFIRINPLVKNGKADSDVTVFRHVLVESDHGSKEEQFAALVASNFPISAVVDSGGVSIHALVRVDAQSFGEWKARAKIVYDYFADSHIDHKNANPSRYSRVPDAFRLVRGSLQRQSLLTRQIGANDWQSWLHANTSDGLPLIVAGPDFAAKKFTEEAQIITGVLEKGSKLVIGGPSKARKTWVLLDLMVSIANGVAWLSFPKSGRFKVLYLNFELSDKQLHKRLTWLMEAKGLTDWSGFDVWNLRGYSADLANLIDRITLRITDAAYDMVLIDPIYKCLGGRNENDTGQMTEFLGHIERLINSIGAAVVFSAHFPKGNLARRFAMDRIAGSGVFARDPDAIITMSPVSAKKSLPNVPRFTIDTTVRNFVEVVPFQVDWRAPLMVPVTEATAEAKTVPLGRKAKYTVEKLIALLPADGWTFTAWFVAASETGMSRSTFQRLLDVATDKRAPLVRYDDFSQKYFHNENYP